MKWNEIKTAKKDESTWVLGVDNRGEQRVIRWCTEYPSEGCWMFAYEPNEYISGIQEFNPSHWMELPKPPKAI